MKLVCISDTHCVSVPNLPEADVLIHSGDWSGQGSEQETMRFIAWLESIEHKYGDIVVVPGNHDRWCFAHPANANALFEQRGWTYLEDAEATIQGKRFYGMPWTPIFGKWAFMTDPFGMKPRCDAIPDGIEILVTHGPPRGFMDEVDAIVGNKLQTIHVGCPVLLEAVERVKPKLHVFGHIHEGAGRFDYGGIKMINASIMDKHYRPKNSYHEVVIP